MLRKIREIANHSFYQLLVIYAILVLLISLSLFWKFSLQMSLFALVISIIGIFTIKADVKGKKSLISKKLHYILFILAIILILLFRIIPYIGNSIPLGYDAGIYKYGIEYGLQNLDSWIIQGGMEPGFLYLMKPISWIFSTQYILTHLLIFFCLILGLSIYLFTKEYFGKETALISLLIYAVSVIQFKVFTYMYYKNIIGLFLMLSALFFLKKTENSRKLYYKILFILTAGILGAIHRPTFYIFGLSYFFYAFISPYKNKKYDLNLLKKNVLYGALILIITSFFYLGRFREAILVMFGPILEGFLQPGEGAGTFINFFTYQYSTLAYLPFALLGFLALAKKKEFNMLFLWTSIAGVIVYFQFFFFNRFIIHLDIALIILAAYGFLILIKTKKKFGIIILVAMLISSGVIVFNESKNSKPLINEQELTTIEQLQNTEQNAFVMATSSYYSPWLQGYSERRVIAPGLFDYNLDNRSQWVNFWTTSNINEINAFLDKYPKPLYVFIGQRQNDNLYQFNSSGCFQVFYENSDNIIYKYAC